LTNFYGPVNEYHAIEIILLHSISTCEVLHVFSQMKLWQPSHGDVMVSGFGVVEISLLRFRANYFWSSNWSL